MNKYFTRCGLYCGACTGMIQQEREQQDQSVSHLINVDNDSACTGCFSPEMSGCEIVECNRAHGTVCCAYCVDFPCSMLYDFLDEWDHHKVVIDNLKRIKEIGIESWLSEQKELWTCKECGSRTQWYQTQCTVCNSLLEQSKPPGS